MAYDILLINPPHSGYGKLKKIRKSSPPLGILSLATYLKQKGYAVKIIDGTVEPELLETERLSKQDFSIVGISSTTPTINNALDIARMIKEIKPNTSTILGGAHPSICYNSVIESEYVDYVIVGEGELSLERVCNSILNTAIIDDYSGIVTKNKRLLPDNIGYIKNLDDLPFPDRRLIPLEKYQLSPINYKRKPSTPVITTRGCPFKCTYCSNPVHGKAVRYHSPEYVVEEIQYLIKEFGIRDIMFWDDTFTLNWERIESICDLILKKNIKIAWSCATRVDRVNESLLALMKKAGCWQISFGVETGVDRLLKKINKGISKLQIETAIKLCSKMGIETRAFFILGIPSETIEESEETINYALSLNTSYVQFTLAVPYPGSDMYEDALSEGWVPPQWEKFNTYPEDNPPYVTSGRNSRELMQIQTKAFKKYYFRTQYIYNRMKNINSCADLAKHAKTALQLFKIT